MKALIIGGTALLGSELLANLQGAVASSRLPRTALRIAFGASSEVSMASHRLLPSVAERTGRAFERAEPDGALAAVTAASSRRAA